MSKKTGHLFERSILEKALTANGNKCPETGVPLTGDDILQVRTGGVISSALPDKSSVPDVLGYIRSEWEALTVELHQAKKMLHETRQELATALYKYDAAVRVIAKLEKERHERKDSGDKGRPPIEKAEIRGKKPSDDDKKERNGGERPGGRGADGDDAVMRLSQGVVQRAKEKGEELQAERKRRNTTGVPSSSTMKSYSNVGRLAIGGKETRICGICTGRRSSLVGCSDGRIHVVDAEKMRVGGSVDGHVGCVNSLQSKNGIVSGGADGVVRLWDEDMRPRGRYDGGGSAVVDAEMHAMGGLLFCCYTREVAWRDAESGAVVGRAGGQFRCGAVHPDGTIFATGGKGVGVWDMASMQCVAQLGDEAVQTVAMSEKGYYMVTCSDEETQIWDLRKQKVVGTMDGGRGLGLDEFGEYGCVVGAEGARLFTAKKKATVVGDLHEFSNTHSGRLGVGWGPAAGFVLVGSDNGMLYRLAPTPSDCAT